ncbi:hypothetical protein FVEG_16252 [Fusarium verticillioides 7600]|uniref:Uncharacterized protein n=1 Tax=Gibberella moniliformis (strain M3125 / FGSC 7600) TaxID=334819 RepID=W7ML62_GIBM7|nr:hypothetical protein FVEG_16252 [Fusarium verticillioides 7600]XP_018754480.1 hypothetical protein FVEG_16252 [Fusarium verticillioides 7600]XP_018754481.1 hypothetical protein FVEG_16252 [Fusarium verticillioides 7600]RBR10455.1 hypothetical protein FVER53590_29262 [Fusarium verticillioides]EWG48288.1 hypothetical protein FVEG_16252 [Fusarium verticillioides 7600]EWG48289.1 hypothetical protein FVEG_16252 [Fusarium verticillioides 7600]EWG48290.1 hypothetical protein FVEG_16252 [Fusarium 
MTTPLYRLMPLSPRVQALQQDATTEVLTLFPVEKKEGLLTYGFPKSCGLLCEALLQDLEEDLKSWARGFGMVIKDLKMPEISPQAFRLEKGNTSTLLKGYTAIVVALGNTKYDVELVSRDKRSSQKETWEPTSALHLRETGLKAQGGHIRFLYIPLHLEPI